jgi:hypothetical protein
MGLGIADHPGWAMAVAASADHEVVDRRRIELIEPGCQRPVSSSLRDTVTAGTGNE